MFNFVVRHLRGLRFVPGLAFGFDCLLLAFYMLVRPRVIAAIEQVETETLAWPGVTKGLHRFGGAELRVGGREIGHLHGNGLLDVPLTRALRQQLVADGKAKPHHIYPASGWISYYMNSEYDVRGAVALLRLSYERHQSCVI
jgi:hypothetical protein